MYKTNYHTHMRFCNHAEGDVIDYVNEAISLGFIELGMTDHAPILESFMNEADYKRTWSFQNMKEEDVFSYLKQIEECKIKFGDKINILSGFETEYLEKEKDFYINLRKKVDYLNLGIHYYEYNNKIIDVYSDVNYDNIDGYLETLKKAMDVNIFNIFVHPDIFMFNYKDKNGNWNFDEKCEKITRSIFELCIKCDVYVEINANGLKYSSNKNDMNMWKYPYVKFWEIAKEYKDLKILISSDAHNPLDLYNDNVEKVIDFANKLNLKIEKKMVIKH